MNEMQLISNVFYILDGHKHDVIVELFGNIYQSYKQEWLERTPFQFWCHLDSSNKQKLIDFTKRRYA